MSASEKLKALRGNYTLLAVVLPQIVAVVEAAEDSGEWLALALRMLPSDALVNGDSALARNRAALAALDEALGNVT